MYLDELFNYKNLLMKDLCSSPEIVALVTGKDDPDVPNHGLPYTQIFPFEYIPETVDEGKTFICFDVDVIQVPNKTYHALAIYLWVFTHKSRMVDKVGGKRSIVVDEISVEIDKILNGNRLYGLGELNAGSVERFTPIRDFQGRVLTYYATDFNRQPGKKPIPSSRKRGG